MPQARHFIQADDAKPPFFVGVDLGGTNIKCGLLDDLGRSLGWASVPTRVEDGPESAAQRMGELIEQVVKDAKLEKKDISRVGLGTPGTMDLRAGRLIAPSNLPGWWDFPIRDRVSEHAGLPVTFANDASAAAYGEFWVGRGKNFQSMVLFTLGTGVGSGIILEHKPHNGEHSAGAELGHIIIDYNKTARVCSCGSTGHLEAYASATAVVRRTEEALASGRKSSLSEAIAGGGKLTPLLVGNAANGGDSLAREIVLETAVYLGVGAVTAMHAFDPTGIFIGGAMTWGQHATELGRAFLARVQEEVKARAFPHLAEHTTIDYASLGGDAGYIGAAGMARLEHKK